MKIKNEQLVVIVDHINERLNGRVGIAKMFDKEDFKWVVHLDDKIILADERNLRPMEAQDAVMQTT